MKEDESRTVGVTQEVKGFVGVLDTSWELTALVRQQTLRVIKEKEDESRTVGVTREVKGFVGVQDTS